MENKISLPSPANDDDSTARQKEIIFQYLFVIMDIYAIKALLA